MITRIISAILLVATLYVVGIFFFPKETDEIGKLAGFPNFNNQVREWKKKSESTSESLSSNLTLTWGVLDEMKWFVNDARQVAESGKNITELKLEQGKKVIESVQKTSEAVSGLKESVGQLTSITGSTSSGKAVETSKK